MKLLKEYYQLSGGSPLKSKNGHGFKVVYVDPKLSTDSTFDNKELMKKYGMEYLPYNNNIKYVKGVPHAWGWVIWDGQEGNMYPKIHKFAQEIGMYEKAPEGSTGRTAEEVLQALDDIKDAIMTADVPEGGEIVDNAEKYKSMLSKGIGSQETMDALEKLVRFKVEMQKHVGHQLSFMNTILIFFQKPDATDVRSEGEWRDMGYTPKPDAVRIVLTKPARFIKLYGEKLKLAIAAFLQKVGVSSEKELTPSQKRRLDRDTKYPDPRGGFNTYIGYDISDLIAGENAETFPENDFQWYDKDSPETEKDRRIIEACVAFGTSIGIKGYEFVDPKILGGSRGTASSNGYVKIVNDKRNKGLASTTIHETAHQVMHWTVVSAAKPMLKKYYRGGPAERGVDIEKGRMIVEQEAELCAWVVLVSFGYDGRKMQEHFNYLSNWGMTIDNCDVTCEAVLKVSQLIYDGISLELQKKYGTEDNETNIQQ